jgi:uncharacterized repeat protein (TIGR02543 family)
MPAEDLTLYAKWDIQSYTLTYLDSDDTFLSSTSYTYGSDLNDAVPSDPERVGYTFEGWDVDLPSTMPAEDITIKATYSINQYTIRFDSNEGTSVTAITQDYATAVSEPMVPTKEGYNFDGWYADEGLTLGYTFTTMQSENITLYAKWDIQSYTLTYLDYDNSVIQTEKIEYGTDLSAKTPSNPEREGYIFEGWDVDLPSTMPAEDITIKALYRNYINYYSIEESLFDTIMNGEYIITSQNEYGGYGKINIFNTNLELLRTIQPSIMTAGDNWSYKTYSSGDYIVAVAHKDIVNYLTVYKISDPDYEQIIYQPYEGLSSYFGISDIEIVGDTLLIADTTNYSRAGSVFEYDLLTSSFVREIRPEAIDSYDYFGSEIKYINDEYFAISAPGYKGLGAIFIYKYDDVTYERMIETKTTNSGNFSENFVIYNHLLIVGNDEYLTNRGIIEIFSLDDENYYQSFVSDSYYYSEYFGNDILVYDGYILVSIPGQNLVTFYRYDYDLQSNSFSFEEKIYIEGLTSTIHYNDNDFYIVRSSYSIYPAIASYDENGLISNYVISDTNLYSYIFIGTDNDFIYLYNEESYSSKGGLYKISWIQFSNQLYL